MLRERAGGRQDGLHRLVSWPWEGEDGSGQSVWSRAIVIEFPAGVEGRGQDVLKQVEKEAPGPGDKEVSTLPFSVRDSTSREQQENL